MEITTKEPDQILLKILNYLQKVHTAGEHILAAYSMVETKKSMPLFIDLEKSEKSKDNLLIAVRNMIKSEYDAINLYTIIKDATDDPEAKKVIESVIDEEKIHSGEFLALLFKLNPDEERLYKQGAKEN